MTATTNGASLEDCLTNIFSLIDLNGIRWKRFKHKENNNYLYTPIDTHPILTTYAKCIEENHIAVWRHEPQKRHSSTAHGGAHSSGGNAGSTGHSNFPTPTRTSNNNTPTGGAPANLNTSGGGSGAGNQNNNSNNNNNTSSQDNYELWIFGYGNQLKVDNVIGEDLVEIEDDTWEMKGLSYECRTLLFKALHNLVERCLILKGFTKFGRWFVQPLSENIPPSPNVNNNNSSSSFNKHIKLEQNSIINSSTNTSSSTTTNQNLSTTISSTIHRILENRDSFHEARKCLDKTDGLRHTSIRSNSSYFTSSLDGSKSSLSFAFSFFVHGDSTVCATVDVRQHPLVHPLTRADLATFQDGGIVRVALTPFGLNGILNGVSYKDSDNGAATTTFIQQWSKFYPLPKTLARSAAASRSQNSAMATNLNQKSTSNPASNQFTNQSNDSQPVQTSRSYLSNLTNMLLPPSTQKHNQNFQYDPNEVPPVVEVIVAGHRMRYPTECVFTTSKVFDPYKSLNLTSRSISSQGGKRPNKSGNNNRQAKLSLLGEKLSEEKQHDSQIKVKSEHDSTNQQSNNFNSPFKLASSDVNTKNNSKLDESTTNTSSRQANDLTKDKLTNGFSDTDNNNLNSTNNQTTIIRSNTSKVGFGANNTPLGPTDLVKLFPTPPSLEQIVLSPPAVSEEVATKEQITCSPINQKDNNFFRDNGIDVYKPVECALMPPPPKWAALTNIIISSSKTLPPECVYIGSSQKSKNGTRLSESSKLSLQTKHSSNLKQININSNKPYIVQQSAPSPLTDQTNKNGFNNLNASAPSPSKTTVSTSLITSLNQNNTITQQPSNNLSTSTGATASVVTTTSSTMTTTTTFSSYTLPHQRLFNNLLEISSIQLNLLLSDSPLGMFKDHNFESCTLCVCNMSIRGTQLDTIPPKMDNNSQWRQLVGDTLLNNPSLFSNEYTNECTCGFSAITNRHCGHLAGLFLEDELELTNVLYDPTEMIDQNKLFRKLRLSEYPESSHNEEQKMLSKLASEPNNKNSNKSTDEATKSFIKQEKPAKEVESSHSNHSVLEDTKFFVIDQLKQQCSSSIHSTSSLSKVLLIESFRNNRHLTTCSNYYAQTTTKPTSSSPLHKFLNDNNQYTTVKMLNRNPTSLKFSDLCELTKSIVTKLGSQNQTTSKLANSLIKPLGGGNTAAGLTAIFSRMFVPTRQSILGKSGESLVNNRNNIFIQGLQALVLPTLSTDPKGALQMLEHLVKEESKEARVILNKAILIFSSPMHDWQFLTAPIPENNFEIANLLKLIQPTLDESIGSHNKLYKDFVHQQQQHIFSARDSPTGAPTQPTPPCQGPLTWRQFHQSAGRGTEDQCEPQPIPSLLVGHHVEKNHLALSPFALKFWDKLLLEPFAPSHNMSYIVIAPDNKNILNHISPFFKELSNTYEIMKLGRHEAIGKGIIIAECDTEESSEKRDWFSDLVCGDKETTDELVKKLRSYSEKFDESLAESIKDFIKDRQPPYDPHADRFNADPTSNAAIFKTAITTISKPVQSQAPNRTFNQLLGSSNLGSSSIQNPEILGVSGESQQLSSDPMSAQAKSQTLIGSSLHGASDDNINLEDEASKQTGIVIYVIDPFSSPSISQNLRTLTTIGLFKCYSMLLDKLPDNIKRITQLQLISLDSIICHSRPVQNISTADQLKSLSMNIYSRCRKIFANQTTAKSLTGFGPSAALENFIKSKKTDPELFTTNMFTPPYILAPMKDKQTELNEMHGDKPRERSSVLFCSYCITEDQRWLLASVTNDKGEMAESTVININALDRTKRSKTTIKRIALKKLMDFIVSIMSDWMNPWRLIIGKLGRVGHGELKEWSHLMSKKSLLEYSKQLSQRCSQCSILPPADTVSILSACLVSLESDSKLRIMSDQFTSDDRQASFNKCPLSTPEDASATHILVFPTSASIQSVHGNVEDGLGGAGLDDDLLNQFSIDDGIEDLGVEDNMDDLFSAWGESATTGADHISSHHDNLMSSSNLHGNGSVDDGANNMDETLQLLQQPLALGYYISTAKIGHMPNWFWSTNPHLRNSCPVFLKSALHIHMPCVQVSDDLLHSSAHSRKSHQLDSNLTTDVLRCVLEGYNSLSWLVLNPKTYDRQSCLPVHMQNLLQLYHLMESFS